MQVRQALGSKVSRERIGTELEGMFNGELGLQQLQPCHEAVAPVTAVSAAAVYWQTGMAWRPRRHAPAVAATMCKFNERVSCALPHGMDAGSCLICLICTVRAVTAGQGPPLHAVTYSSSSSSSDDDSWPPLAVKTPSVTTCTAHCCCPCPLPAGASPAAAVRLLQQLCLFPQVFTPPQQLQQLLGNAFGGPCTELIEAAQALLQEVGLQVSSQNNATRLQIQDINGAPHAKHASSSGRHILGICCSSCCHAIVAAAQISNL